MRTCTRKSQMDIVLWFPGSCDARICFIRFLGQAKDLEAVNDVN